MAGDTSLFAAFIDGGRRHRFFGVRMRPFCLWHLLLLQAVDSPFLRLGNVTLFDLMTAVGICRLHFGDSRICRPWVGPVGWWKLSRKDGFRKEVVRFLHYTGDFLHKPEYAVHQRPLPANAAPPPERHAAPETLSLAADIIGWTHWPEKIVWELPMGAVYWYRAMALRAAGADIDFVTPEDMDFQAKMKAAGLQPPGSPQQAAAVEKATNAMNPNGR